MLCFHQLETSNILTFNNTSIRLLSPHNHFYYTRPSSRALALNIHQIMRTMHLKTSASPQASVVRLPFNTIWSNQTAKIYFHFTVFFALKPRWFKPLPPFKSIPLHFLVKKRQSNKTPIKQNKPFPLYSVSLTQNQIPFYALS